MRDMADIEAFLLVARARGFREASRIGGRSSSSLSDAVKRLETDLGLRLLNRTTRSVLPTEAGRILIERLGPAFAEIGSALDQATSHCNRAAGSLKLNVPASAARLVLPRIVPAFLMAYPDIRLEIVTDENFIDIIESGCDAGIRYDERLEQDMIAVPIGPREQRFALAASPDYLAARGTPKKPQDLLVHDCIRGRFANRAIPAWEFERKGDVVLIEPTGRLIVQSGGATDLGIEAAKAGLGILYLFEDWLTADFQTGALSPIMEDWWLRFSGPFLYYPGRRLVPSPLRAFIDFVRAMPQPGLAKDTDRQTGG